MRLHTVFSLLILLLSVSGQGRAAEVVNVSETRPSDVDQAVLAVIFSGSEVLHYAVSWSGGVKIGDIYMKIEKEKTKDGAFAILARVKDYGPLRVLYPVDDTFACLVSGPMKLPYSYKVQQREGYGKETTRLTQYDQENRLVRYRKNKEDEQTFAIAGTVYNEFAAFIITRALTLREGESVIVPTFVESKRQEVKVELVQREKRPTVFGEKATLKVLPQLHFKGLYEKSGTTVLWLTDDRCRVPVEIHSKIVIGSLVAELVEYANSACPELLPATTR